MRLPAKMNGHARARRNLQRSNSYPGGRMFEHRGRGARQVPEGLMVNSGAVGRTLTGSFFLFAFSNSQWKQDIQIKGSSFNFLKNILIYLFWP
jgi:hypothetical protein